MSNSWISRQKSKRKRKSIDLHSTQAACDALTHKKHCFRARFHGSGVNRLDGVRNFVLQIQDRVRLPRLFVFIFATSKSKRTPRRAGVSIAALQEESRPNTKSTQEPHIQPNHAQTLAQYRTHARSNHLDFLDAGIEGGHVELVLLTAHTVPVHEYARACADVCSPASRARSCGRYPIPRHMQLACVARVKQGAESACNAVFEGRGNAHPGPCGGSASACMPRPVSADRRQEEERSAGRPRARSRASPPDGAKNASVAGASRTAASRSSAAGALTYMIASRA